MDSAKRREKVKKIIAGQETPISASSLAKRLGVSRQIIVGDVALLRAGGCDITATARGYLFARPHEPRYLGKVACQHSQEDTGKELYAVVDLGGEVVDVIVEHHLYGEMTGRLEISCRRDVDVFIQRVEEKQAHLLSELTGGVHLHTIACRDAAHFEEIRRALASLSLLYDGNQG